MGTPSSSNARCCTAVGSAMRSNSTPGVDVQCTRLLQSVARSPRRHWKLCTGRPCAVASPFAWRPQSEVPARRSTRVFLPPLRDHGRQTTTQPDLFACAIPRNMPACKGTHEHVSGRPSNDRSGALSDPSSSSIETLARLARGSCTLPRSPPPTVPLEAGS